MPFAAPTNILLGFPRPTRQKSAVTLAERLYQPLPMLFAPLLLAGAAAVVYAQIEGSDRVVIPIDTSGSLEVPEVVVDVYAKTADAARLGGWRLAQRKAWKELWGKYHPGTGAPALPDGTLDSMVSSIVVGEEQISANRYIARLGVLFDRARAGQILGVSGGVARSLPMLVIPVQWSGGRPESFEHRTEWQQAWARLRTGSGPIDYVRATGAGSDPLLLNAAQSGRRNRNWWRLLLDQYGAADVLVPTVKLERQWPGGPVIGRFTAGFGPDSRIIDQFTLRAENSAALPKMLDEGVRRLDEAYSRAQAVGMLRPDPTLIIEEPVDTTAIENALPAEDTAATDLSAPTGALTVTVQFETPDVSSISRTEAALRGIPGVSVASTTSLALGGISVMRVVYAGDLQALRTALVARGWRVDEGGGALRIRRGQTPPPALATPPSPAPSNAQGAAPR
jgi:hypothetical protein